MAELIKTQRRLPLNDDMMQSSNNHARSKANEGTLLPWSILNRDVVFSALPWLKLFVEKVKLPDGKIINDFYHLDIPDFVVIFAETLNGEIITIRQYKHGVRRVSLTLAGGQVDTGEDPLRAAKRELLEETGYQSPSWQHLGSFTSNGNLGCGRGHFYLARKAYKVQQPCSGDLEEMEINILSYKDLKQYMHNGDVVLLNHAMAISLALNKITA